MAKDRMIMTYETRGYEDHEDYGYSMVGRY
jgi:hypothetical protein